MKLIKTYKDGGDAIRHAKALARLGNQRISVLKNLTTQEYELIQENEIKDSFTISTSGKVSQ